MALVTLKTFDKPIDAHLLKSKLESEGIVCYLFDENTVSINPLYNFTIGGIKLKINDFDSEKALEICREIANTPYTDSAKNPILCPNCGSADLYTNYSVRKGFKGFISSFMALLLTMVPFYDKKMYKCKACQAEFVSKN